MDMSQLLQMFLSGQSQQNSMLNSQTAGFGEAGKQATLGAMQYGNPVSDMNKMDVVNQGMQNFSNPQSPLLGLVQAMAMSQQNKQQNSPQQRPPMQRMQVPTVGQLSSAQMPQPPMGIGQAPMGMAGMTPEMMQRLMMMRGM